MRSPLSIVALKLSSRSDDARMAVAVTCAATRADDSAMMAEVSCAARGSVVETSAPMIKFLIPI